MKRVVVCGALLLAALAPALRAQTCSNSNPGGSCTVTVSVSPVTIGTILQMSVSTSAVTLTAPALGNFGADSTATITDASAVSVTGAGNVAFHVTMAATASTWTSVAPPTPKPTSDLTWATAVGGPYTAMSTTPTTIISAASASNTITKVISYRTIWHFIDNPPGTYSLTLTYTLVSP